MPQIKRLSDNELFTVASFPVYDADAHAWDCGEKRFVDPDGTAFAPVGYPSLAVNAGHFYSLFSNQSQQDIEAATDPRIRQLLLNVNKLIQSGGTVDLGSTTVQQGLGLLATTTVPGSDPARFYIEAPEIARISTNQLP